MAKAKSARGLFAATGKKPKPAPVRLPDGSYTKAPHRERSEDDFDRTPPEVTRTFLAAEAWRLKDMHIWEPAAGDGAMVRVMWEMGYRVRFTDMVDRGFKAEIASFYDFTAVAPEPTPWGIITNPPFSECSWGLSRARWIAHALDELDAPYLALLLPLNWCSAAGMRAFYERHTPARIYSVTWRIDFTGQGAQPASHAWYVWDKSCLGPTTFHLLYKSDDPRQPRMI